MYVVADTSVIERMRQSMKQRIGFSGYMDHLVGIYKKLVSGETVDAATCSATIDFGDVAGAGASAGSFVEIETVAAEEGPVRSYLARAGFELLDFGRVDSPSGEAILTLKVKAGNPSHLRSFLLPACQMMLLQVVLRQMMSLQVVLRQMMSLQVVLRQMMSLQVVLRQMMSLQVAR
jgi:hypothetical protein